MSKRLTREQLIKLVRYKAFNEAIEEINWLLSTIDPNGKHEKPITAIIKKLVETRDLGKLP